MGVFRSSRGGIYIHAHQHTCIVFKFECNMRVPLRHVYTSYFADDRVEFSSSLASAVFRPLFALRIIMATKLSYESWASMVFKMIFSLREALSTALSILE